MPELSGIYDSGPIVPVCKIKENLAILTGGDYHYFPVEFIEPLPRSSPLVADMVQIVQGVAAAVGIAANATLNQALIQFLRINKGELLHLRFEAIDDIEFLLWETASIGRFATNFLRARVSRFTAFRDHNLASTTFFVMGQDNDINLQAVNPNAVLAPQARVAFWGYRYILGKEFPVKPQNQGMTYVPAEGRGVGSSAGGI
ncbi:MAG: hypothetical protein PHN44_00690 [Candidatus Marinimicrobia bacterium]|nr:hypothetical protein [Candidatus Neomarinimicrobiota bacterium]MDD5539117.1 hypothetical protein [Candidatus Neomarinimicrobiota bacterium]